MDETTDDLTQPRLELPPMENVDNLESTDRVNYYPVEDKFGDYPIQKVDEKITEKNELLTVRGSDMRMIYKTDLALN